MKTYNIFTGLFIILLSIGSACHLFDDDDINNPPCNTGIPFTLWYGQSTDCEEWTIAFNGDVQDSRCPASVTCVWAGRVDMELQVGEEVILLGLPDDPNFNRAKDTLGNTVIELLEVLPEVETPEEIPNELYRIKLLVTDL